MKKITIFTFALIILSACTTSPEPQTQEAAFQKNIPTLNTETDPVEQALDVDTILTAVRLQDKELCESIENKIQSQECLSKVEDAILEFKALEEENLNTCEKIKQNSTKERCKALVEERISFKENAEKLNADLEMIGAIEKSKDIKGCEKISDANLQDQCRDNIHLVIANENKDASNCKKIKNIELQSLCQQSIEN